MTDRAHQLANWRRPSTWHLFHLAMAIVGITALSIGLGGELRIRAGLNGTDALNHEGVAALVFALSLGYAFRLIFWGKVPPHDQALARNLLSLILCAEIVLAVVALYLRATQGDVQPADGAAGMVVATVFTVAGVLCQISTVIWLLRYRRE